ncbi:hypothetical protein LAZ67_7001562 [Cordylochernes scorpioides]|uniref:Uncharacterized protein n=1 Tax=Cordylochernes scorpioides TaxID=51811 RepID=A0ABY6KR02_9ARAC|nr:hypothetical protein LAZ67_7001562 [Cordylochernes scorpioides]
MLDRRMTVRQIEETLGFSKTVKWIMREHVGLKKLSVCRGVIFPFPKPFLSLPPSGFDEFRWGFTTGREISWIVYPYDMVLIFTLRKRCDLLDLSVGGLDQIFRRFCFCCIHDFEHIQFP